jgi:hypothetical protein
MFVVQRGKCLGFASESRDAIRIGGEARAGSDRDVTAEAVSRARYTSPMPPAPSDERTSYGPSRVPGVRLIKAE